MSSILNDVKLTLGLLPGQTAHDNTIVIFINSAFSELTQLGAGPPFGFQITGPDESWANFETDPRLNSIKSYVYLVVKIAYDPPKAGYLVQALSDQKRELAYRINLVAEYDLIAE